MSVISRQKFLPTMVSVIAGLSLLTNDALAQDESHSGPVEEVLIQGIRSSLQEGISVKRDATQFVDSIVADDIGKLPDANVAESLARVSGVQVDRGIGEGTSISIRGQRENVFLLNGRQIFDATGRGGIGLDQLGTSTYGLLSLIPSEVIQRLDVTKLAAADDVEGGLGGVVDIETRKPFDKPGLQLAGSIGLTDEELADDQGTELFGMVSNTWADDTFGVLLGLSISERNLAEEGLNTFSGYGIIDESSVRSDQDENNDGMVDNNDLIPGDVNGDGVSGILFLDPRYQQISEARDKQGANLVVQWRPSDQLTATFDTFYSETEADRDRHWIGYFAGFGQHRNVTFSENEVLLSGIVTRPIQTNVEFADVESEILSSAINLDWTISDSITNNTVIASTTSESSYDQFFFRLQSANATDITYDITAGDYGSIEFPFDLTDPSGLNLAIMFDQVFLAETDTTEISTDFDIELDNDIFESIETGIRLQNIDTNNSQTNVDIRPNLPVQGNLEPFITLFENPSFLSGELPGLPRSYLTGDESALVDCNSLASIWTPEQQATCDAAASNTSSRSNTFDIDEEFLSVYAKANFRSGIASGNFGLRFVNRDLTSSGFVLSDGELSPNVFDRSDSEILPSAVVKLDLSDELIARLGAARVIAFPNTADLNNGLQLFGDMTGRGGSPDLDPFLANQFDASIEYYFDEGSLLSAGVFIKDVDTFIVQEGRQEEVPGQAVPFIITRQINGEGADVSGLELLYQQQFLNYFGVQATYSYIDSQTPVRDANDRELPLPGLSENNVNLVTYYENDRFSARLAFNWRDEYLAGVEAGGRGIFFDEYADLSATLNYSFNDNISLNFEALNLLDSQLEQFVSVQEAVRRNAVYGQIYKFTLSGKF